MADGENGDGDDFSFDGVENAERPDTQSEEAV